MKSRILRILILVTIIGALVYFNGGINLFTNARTVRAFGSLTVDFHIQPLFSILNGKPGDIYGPKPVDVTNNGTTPVMVAVKGIRTGGVGTSPLLESALDIVIKNGSLDVYGGTAGHKTLLDFFNDSAGDGVKLGNFNPNDHKTYNFTVTFPAASGNPFQGKSVIFDLTFGTVTQTGTTITISGNGAGSKTTVISTQTNTSLVKQINNTVVRTIINIFGSGTANISVSGSRNTITP